MSEVDIRIGGRPFTVACQPGEEPFLQSAARLLDTEASALVQQLGKMPENQMLLMAGLMLADKMAGLQDNAAAGRPAAQPAPAELGRLSALAARAEAVADDLARKAGVA